MILVLLILLSVTVASLLFNYYYPPLGGHISDARKTRVNASKNHTGRIFVNQIETSMKMGTRAFVSILREEFTRNPARRPAKPLQPSQPTMDLYASTSGSYITWLGHSAFMVRMQGKTILLDPMLSKTASPFQSLGPKRFPGAQPITLETLPPIDIVVISHDHYDHLDYASIKTLARSAKHFFVPLGVGAHLEKWGVTPARITELDWWDEATFEGVTLVCTPSRHFSGRSLTDRFATLWASWVVKTQDTVLYFSGDSGYGPHFKQIGDKYGPFDLTLLECGQYDPRWENIHMTPENTVNAHRDLRGKRMVPMHWGAFTLAFHSWTDPVERAVIAAKQAGFPIATPAIGQTFAITDGAYPTDSWWTPYK